MDRRATIIDMAIWVGVSKATVSLVLQQSSKVKQETREDAWRVTAPGLITRCAGLQRPVNPAPKIVGFDDIEDCAQALPALIWVCCGIAGFGRHMAKTVLTWRLDSHRLPPDTITPATLIPRASSFG